MKRLLFLFVLLCMLIKSENPVTHRAAQAAPQAASQDIPYTQPQPYLVKDINPSYLTRLGDALYFRANNGLWKSDGTETGTVMIKGFDSESQSLNGLITSGDSLFFSVLKTSDPKQCELWKSDGTNDGTIRVKEFYPGSSVMLSNLIDVNGTVFFVLEIRLLHDSGYTELWRSDGTEIGTVWLKQAALQPAPQRLKNVNGTLYFAAMVNNGGIAAWKSNGTPEGTLMVKGGVSMPDNFTYFDGWVFFTGTVNGNVEILKTDGTETNTILVTTNSDDSGFDRLVVANNLLFFAFTKGGYGNEPGSTNGTGPGTKLLKDIHPTPNTGSQPGRPTNLNKTLLLFPATHPVTGRELWKSDGSEIGTVLVKDINPNGNSDPFQFTVARDRLFFIANDGSAGEELWVSDGTEAGTKRLSDINPTGDALAQSYHLVEINGLLFFTADDGNGNKLWALSLQDLALTQSVSPQTPIAPGQPVMYTISFQNNGHIPAAGVTITDTLPAQLTNVSWSSTGITVTQTGANPLTWQVDDIEPGQGGTITVLATVANGLPGGSSFANTVTLANSLREMDRANNTGTASVTVANAAPLANDDALIAVGGHPNGLSVLANDSDPNGDALSVSSVTQPAHGTAAANGTNVLYTPQADYEGSDSLSYTVSDGHGGTDSASVNVTVWPTLFSINLPLVIRNWPPVTLIDDAPDTCESAYPITSFGELYQDDFDKDPDPDWYRFDAVKGANYTVNVSSSAETTPVLRLYDTDCHYLELQGTPLDNGTRLQWTHGWDSGRYYLFLYEGHGLYGPNTSYQLTIQESP